MKYTKDNIKGVSFSNLLDHRIHIIKDRRKGSRKGFNGKPNCSGYNINKQIHNGMTVREYRGRIRKNFNPDDPQFDLSKHLRWDIQQGDIVLVDEICMSKLKIKEVSYE